MRRSTAGCWAHEQGQRSWLSSQLNCPPASPLPPCRAEASLQRPLSCVCTPCRHSVSHKRRVTHNDSLGEVPAIYPHAVLGSAVAMKFLFILPKNTLYSVTVVCYTICFSVCFFCCGHLTSCRLCAEAKWPTNDTMHSHSILQAEVAALQNS